MQGGVFFVKTTGSIDGIFIARYTGCMNIHREFSGPSAGLSVRDFDGFTTPCGVAECPFGRRTNIIPFTAKVGAHLVILMSLYE